MTYTTKLKAASSLLVIFISTVMLSVSANAETNDTVHLGKAEVSKQQIIELLSPNANGAPKTRGLRLHKKEESVDVSNTARALSLEVYFQFNSADLTADAVQQLRPVGEALSSNELANLEFTLEGHTDASGDENYNLTLSERRAETVKKYFVENYSLSPDRVQAEGKGEAELIDALNPISGVNRRVTIIAQ